MSVDDSEEDTTSVFETTASYRQSRLDYGQEQFAKWVGRPMTILWDDYRGRFGILVLLFYIGLGTVGTVLVGEPSTMQASPYLSPLEDPRFLLGTDGLGQDLFALMVHATPDMFKMIIGGALFGTTASVVFGLVSGYYGGTIDKAIMTFTDTLASIPGLPLIIVVSMIVQPESAFLVGVIVNIQGWAGGARGLRAQVIPLANKAHVEATRAMGIPTSDLLVKDIMSHLLPLIFIGMLGGATRVIVASSALYFLGILPFATQNWGITLNYAYEAGAPLWSLSAAHWLIVPVVTITLLNLGFTLLAQATDQVFNPRVRARHRRTIDEDDFGPDQDDHMAETQSKAATVGDIE